MQNKTKRGFIVVAVNEPCYRWLEHMLGAKSKAELIEKLCKKAFPEMKDLPQEYFQHLESIAKADTTSVPNFVPTAQVSQEAQIASIVAAVIAKMKGK